MADNTKITQDEPKDTPVASMSPLITAEPAPITAEPDSSAIAPEGQLKLKKRKPGRPPKKKVGSINVETNGIVSVPVEEDNVIEMVYENPKLFKRLLAMLKGYSVEVVTWNFIPDKVEVATKGINDSKPRIFIIIYAKMLVRYYCARPTSVTMKRDDLDLIFQNVDKNNTQITIIAKEEDIKSKIYFIIKNTEIDVEKNYEIQLVGRSEKDVADSFRDNKDEEYPLKFCLPGKEFKTLIQDAGKESKLITIRKDSGSEPLTIGCELTTKNNLNMVFKNPDKIELKSSLDPRDIFNVSTRIQYIKPFSNSNIGDKIYISADKNRPVIFAADIDKKKYENERGETVEGPVCQVKIYADMFVTE